MILKGMSEYVFLHICANFQIWIKRRKVIDGSLNQVKFGIGPMIEIWHYVKFKSRKLRILNIGTW